MAKELSLKVRFAAVALLLLASACAGGSRQAALTTAPSATAGAADLEAAHDFTLATFDGDTFTLSDHFGELPIVLNFWAPW